MSTTRWAAGLRVVVDEHGSRLHVRFVDVASICERATPTFRLKPELAGWHIYKLKVYLVSYLVDLIEVNSEFKALGSVLYYRNPTPNNWQRVRRLLCQSVRRCD
jgi:hypothetical protein